MPKISVLMSVYNEPVDWMRQAIESILNQTYKDFEFIIVNDNPEREENQLILNEYRDKDSRISVLCNDQNIGLTKSLNKGLENANCEFVARMDADDIAFPDRLKLQLQYLLNNPDIAVLGTNAIAFKGAWFNFERELLMPQSYDSICICALFFNPLVHPTVMFNMKMFKKRLYNEQCKRAQDFDLWVRLIKSDIKICNMPIASLKYRIVNKGSDYFVEQNSVAENARLQMLDKIMGEAFRKKNEDLHLYVCAGTSSLPHNIDEIERYLIDIRNVLSAKYPAEKTYIKQLIGNVWLMNCKREKVCRMYFMSELFVFTSVADWASILYKSIL